MPGARKPPTRARRDTQACLQASSQAKPTPGRLGREKLMPSYAMDQSTAGNITLSPLRAGLWISLHDAHPNQASSHRSSKIVNSPFETSTTTGNQLQPQSLIPGTHFQNNQFTIIIHSPRSLDQHLLSKGGLNLGPDVEAPFTTAEKEEDYFQQYPVVRALNLAFSNAKQSNLPYSRSLIPEFNVFCDDMTAVASAPGSPPDLS
jgi:hypothetical protein